jgi:hydroxymethylpyrimidine pyrophosphatase-like HAD family hydrolase
LFFLGNPEHLLRVEQALLTAFPDQLNLSFSLSDCLEVMAVGVSKGHALDLILQAEDTEL